MSDRKREHRALTDDLALLAKELAVKLEPLPPVDIRVWKGDHAEVIVSEDHDERWRPIAIPCNADPRLTPQHALDLIDCLKVAVRLDTMLRLTDE